MERAAPSWPLSGRWLATQAAPAYRHWDLSKIMPAVVFRSILVDTSSDDEVGRLILSDGRLVGVLVRLDGEEHGPLKGSWFLEAGFGPMSSAKPEPFKDLSETQLWVERILGPDGKEIVSAPI